jgi:hypothetical protein
MKNIQTLLRVVLCSAIVGAAIQASAQPARPCHATVVRVQGSVSYSLGDNNWHPLVSGKYLPPGASIRTGDNGVVDVVLGIAVDFPQAGNIPSRIGMAPDYPVRGFMSYKPTVEQNAIRLTENSLLTIDKLTTTDTGADTVSDTELDLKQGALYASVKKLSAAAQYIVKTPTGIIGVRGTQFNVALNGNGSISSLAVYKTTNDDGLILSQTLPSGGTQTMLIGQGQMYEAGSVQPVSVSPAVLQMLQQVFPSLRTVGVPPDVGFEYDHTITYVSPDFGHHNQPVSTALP